MALSIKLDAATEQAFRDMCANAEPATSQAAMFEVLVKSYIDMQANGGNALTDLQAKYNTLEASSKLAIAEQAKEINALTDKLETSGETNLGLKEANANYEIEITGLKEQVAKLSDLTGDVKELSNLTIIRKCIHNAVRIGARKLNKSASSITEDAAVEGFVSKYKD